MKLYGNIINRFSENKTLTEDKILHEGDDITMYMWSDRHCYYITKVKDQKHISVKEYFVVADHDAPLMSNTWKYFKTFREQQEYLKKYFYDTEILDRETSEEDWEFRNNTWKRVSKLNKDIIKNILSEYYDIESQSKSEQEQSINNYINSLDICESKKKKLFEGETISVYHNLSGKVSFGVRDYYYDYEF